MARSEELTISYRDVMSIPFAARQTLTNSNALMEAISNQLTPGQRASLFPSYYKEDDKETAAAPLATSSDIKALGKSPKFSPYLSSIPAASPAAAQTQTQTQARSSFKVKNITGKEQAVLDMIARREGAKDPNIIFGDVGGKAGSGAYSQQLRNMGYTKPLTEMTISEVRAMQKDLIKLTKGKIGKGELGTSAVGSGQMIGSTLEANLAALGIPESEWGNIKFDADLQAKLTLQNFKDTVGDPNNPSTWKISGLEGQWESFDTRKGFAPLSQQELAAVNSASSEVIQEASATPVNFEDSTTAQPKTASELGAEQYAASASIIPNADDIMGDIPQSLAQNASQRTLQALGLNERDDKEALKAFIRGEQLDPERTSWCAAILNSSLASAGLKGTGSDIANSFQTYGQGVNLSEAKAGDIIVNTRGGGPNDTGGHVMQATGNATYDDKGRLMIEVVGGNEGQSGRGSVKKHFIYPNENFVARRTTAAEILDPALAAAASQQTTAQTQTAATELKQEVAGASPVEIAKKVEQGNIPPDVSTNIDTTADIAKVDETTTAEVSNVYNNYNISQSTEEPVPVVAMAEGGIINKPYLADPIDGKGPKVLMGEKGSEAVVPQKKMTAKDFGADSVSSQMTMIMDTTQDRHQNPQPNVDAEQSRKDAVAKITQVVPGSKPGYSVAATHRPPPASLQKAMAYAVGSSTESILSQSPIGTAYRHYGYKSGTS